MPKGKTLILIIIIALLITIMVILLITNKKGISIIPIPVQTTPQTTPAPTPIRDFIILSTDITEPTIGYSQFIKIKFSKEVFVPNIKLQLIPDEDINLFIDSDKQTLIIAPHNTWKIDQEYTVKILRSTTSDTGQFLDKDYQFKFKTPPYTGI